MRSIQSLIDDLLSKSMTTIQNDAKNAPVLAKALEKFNAFCALPDKVKTNIFADLDREGKPDTGLTMKRVSSGDGDNKDFFHFRLMTLRGNRAIFDLWPEAPTEVAELLDASLDLYEESLALLRPIVSGLDVKFPGLMEQMYPYDGLNMSAPTLRFLKYYAGPRAIIARPHSDRSALTIQWHESKEGLHGSRMDWKEPEWKEFFCGNHYPEEVRKKIISDILRKHPVKKTDPNDRFVFTAEQLWYFSRFKLPSWWHYVEDIDALEEGHTRDAVVFFHKCKDVEINEALLH